MKVQFYPVRNPPNRLLRVGQIIELLAGAHEVLRVSESGAVVRPLAKRQVEVKTLGGKEVKFSAPLNTFSICAESEVMILAPRKEDYKP